MFKVKRDYQDETKEILKKLNSNWYNYSYIYIKVNNNSEDQLILNDNEKTTININFRLTLMELLHAFYDHYKSYDFI